MDGYVTSCEKMADFWPKRTDSDRFLARGGSNDISNAVFLISAQNSQIRKKFAWITFFSLWTVKLLFVIFGRLSYTFL